MENENNAAITREDLKRLEDSFTQRMDRMEESFNQRMDRMEESFTQRMERMEDSLLRAVASHIASLEPRFEAIDRRFDAAASHIAALDPRFEARDRRFDALDRRFDSLELRLDHIGNTVTGLQFNATTMNRWAERLDKMLIRQAATLEDHERILAKLRQHIWGDKGAA